MPDNAPVISPSLYERLLPDVRTNYDAHDKTCPSMRWFWMGARGGVSALGDQRDCDTCEHTFYLDGLAWINWRTTDQDDDDLYLCGCCAVTAGHKVRMGTYGLSVVDPT